MNTLRRITIILSIFTLSSCACFKPASPEYNAKKCVVARKVVDCAKGSVADLFLAVGPALVVALLSGAPIDLQEIADRAEKGGFGAGLCIVTALQTELTKPGAAPSALATATKAHSMISDLAHKLYGPGPVDVKIKRLDGTVVVVSVP